MPQQRTWTVTFTGVAPVAVDELIVTVGGAEVVPDVSYDTEALSLSVTVADAPVTQAVSIHATNGLRYADDPAIEDAFTVLYNAQIDYLAKERAYRLIKLTALVRSMRCIRWKAPRAAIPATSSTIPTCPNP